jgi:hypothetical protein
MTNLSRRSFIRFAALGALTSFGGQFLQKAHAATPVLKVYKTPYCGCCGSWVAHMHEAGFKVNVTNLEDLAPIKAKFGIARDLQSCHTGIIEDYVIEGHVPAGDVSRLLLERPTATGLAVPGMPIGSPGLEQGGRKDPYQVVLFSATERRIFARH